MAAARPAFCHSASKPSMNICQAAGCVLVTCTKSSKRVLPVSTRPSPASSPPEFSPGSPVPFCGACVAAISLRLRSPGSDYTPTVSSTARPGKTGTYCPRWKKGCAAKASPASLAPQLLDLELEMADECFRAGEVGLGIGSLGLCAGRFGLGARCERLRLDTGSALGKDHRVRGDKIGGKRFGGGHADDGITFVTIRKPKPYPTDVGRHVSCGCLQSMPDNR